MNLSVQQLEPPPTERISPPPRVVTPHWSLGRQQGLAAETSTTSGPLAATQKTELERRPLTRTERKEATPRRRTWLDDDPITWLRRKVRSRKNGSIYTVRQVFRNGRVELEKSWMTYSSDIQNIRTSFETAV